MKYIVGIDPGLSGAIALYDGTTIVVHDIPTIKVTSKRSINLIELADMFDKITKIGVMHAFIEKVGVFPGDGKVGAFNFGFTYGTLMASITSNFWKYTAVTPAMWKKSMGIPSGSGKDASRALAQREFQRDAGLFSRVKDDGRAEAALIALYGYRKLQAIGAAQQVAA